MNTQEHTTTETGASVIILNFNYAEYLGDCIASALNQTAAPEIIVVDDGSTDNSRSIIEAAGTRVKPVYKPNGGMHTAMNAGFAASNGRIVIFLDADDTLLPSAVESAVGALSDPQVVHCHWPMHVVDSEGNRTGRTRPEYKLSEGDLLPQLVMHGPDACHFAPTSGNAWSRGFLFEVMPIRDERFRRHAEVYLGTLAPVFGPVAHLPCSLGSYRMHDRNDYSSASLAERNRRNLNLFEARCDVLANALSMRGHNFDRQNWKRGRNAYLWMSELGEVLPRCAPEGSRIILMDGNESVDPVPGRQVIPFPEKNGAYWGPPANSMEAIAEFERERKAGATFAVLAWPCFWWRESYAQFFEYLRSHFECVYESESLVVFVLKQPEP